MKTCTALVPALLLSTAAALVDVHAQTGTTAFTGMRLIDGSGQSPVDNATVVVANGRITAVGAGVQIPAGATRVSLAGKTVIPGIVNGHGHVNAIDPVLATYAKHGVTTVFSLGNDGNAVEALAVRDRQNEAKLARTRLFTSGVIVTGPTPEAARAQVQQNAKARVDIIKIRVDDNFGTTAKMTADTYRAVMDEAHKNNLRVAAHLYYLQDAKSLLAAGADLMAHSIRDREVDADVIATLKAKNVCLVPTLTRDLSTFVYESVPPFFSDPLFQKYADAAAVTTLRTPARLQARAADPNNPKNKAGLEMAQRNLKALSAAGVTIAMGTDSGAGAERFPGYFELLEMEMMVQSGLTPAQVITSATRDAARCLGQGDTLGTLTTGKFADLVVLDANPLDDIANIKKISAVYVGGQQVAR